ncbi:MAG TPA: hypothetical protein VKT82_14395 [Ktedonobacterales bacterium]|nr:hypothetical protein [Ktedonobacterales bacterium]
MSKKRTRSIGGLFSRAASYGCIGIVLLFTVLFMIAGGIAGFTIGNSLWGLAGGILGAVIGPIAFFVVAQIGGLGEKLDD